MACACIDIGTNTTRLLVAEQVDGQLRELAAQRAFTRIGAGRSGSDPIGERKVAEVAEVVARQARIAGELGVEDPRVVATATIREAPDADALGEAIAASCGLAMDVLTADEEARLAFAGATLTLAEPAPGRVAAVDVGGGSTDLALGTVAGGADWTASLRLGSGMLADAYLGSDPPAIAELNAVREHVEGAFDGLVLERPDLAVAVGGSAGSLRRLVGSVLEPETLERGMRVVAGRSIAEVARAWEIDPRRVRLLPAGILILEAASRRLGQPLSIARGGLREGVVLEHLAAVEGSGA